MKVILLEKIHNLGDLGSMVNVKSGYGRNYLIPQSKAVIATPANVKEFETRRAELEKQAQESLAAAQKRAEQFNGLEITIAVKAMDEGKLFGSVGVREIVDALQAKNIEVEKKEINMPSGAIQQIGEYDITIRLHSDVTATIKVIVEAE
ncbi:MAG: 50S ribosomal protein L9 [Pseudomonadota bacterium]|nr:50S ribosomal protein L9 [Gammaproteobacteria bacterium]MBU1628727.1 50S ribosomal protein L9 [Gammaproteobacteria bacterium]MBU1927004.1 50S ribosomal protein L9 [Gammaproteobacteria bacterium]MBU2546003.1 50S ribosomal protein L9 [Gammaproteobacteria bacterium]